jgi:hypothetical protein
MLNTSKGPAVRALRAQADKLAYGRAMREAVEGQAGLTLREGMVEGLLVEHQGNRSPPPPGAWPASACAAAKPMPPESSS